MDVPRIMLSARKRFARAVALAAVFVLLAGGASALANTVWHVDKTSSTNCSNTPPVVTTCNTIQSAVGATSLYDVVVVAPGYYNETVYISQGFISILGAQAGRDARQDRHNSANESIVDASGTPPGSGYGAAFLIFAANNVTIDGFTIQGGGVVETGSPGTDASGIYVNSGGSARILNNIIQGNAVGLFLNSNAYNLVEHNRFESNNAGKGGASTAPFYLMAGFGIVGVDLGATAITENEFRGNMAAALVLQSAQGTEVTKNTSEKDGSLAVIFGGGSNYVSHNRGRDFAPKLPLPSTLTVSSSQPAGAAIDVGSGGTGQKIEDNDLQEGKTPNYNGIAFGVVLTPGPCTYCPLSNNRIEGFAGNGIVAAAGTLQVSSISGNHVKDNGTDGILIEEGSSNTMNSLLDNKTENNSTNDCEDDTYLIEPGQSGTAGTRNTWFHNLGSSSDPPGLCSPATGHPYE